MQTTILNADQNFRNLPRRRFSKEEKRRIVREFLHLGIPLARFARERALHYNQLSRWRKDYLAGKFGPISTLCSPDLQWLPVTVEKPASPARSPANPPERLPRHLASRRVRWVQRGLRNGSWVGGWVLGLRQTLLLRYPRKAAIGHHDARA